MPERWRRELRRLDEVHPSDDVWDRARLGSTQDLPGLRPGSRLTALLVSLLVVSLVGVGLWIRLGILETPVFQELLNNRKIERTPIVEVFKKHPRDITGHLLSSAHTGFRWCKLCRSC